MNHIHIHHSVKVTMRKRQKRASGYGTSALLLLSVPVLILLISCGVGGRWGLRVYQLSFFLDCNIPNHSTLSQLQSKKLDHYHCNQVLIPSRKKNIRPSRARLVSTRRDDSVHKHQPRICRKEENSTPPPNEPFRAGYGQEEPPPTSDQYTTYTTLVTIKND